MPIWMTFATGLELILKREPTNSHNISGTRASYVVFQYKCSCQLDF